MIDAKPVVIVQVFVEFVNTLILIYLAPPIVFVNKDGLIMDQMDAKVTKLRLFIFLFFLNYIK